MSSDKVQTFLTEVSTVTLLEQSLQFAITTALSSNEVISVKVSDPKFISFSAVDQNTQFPVILISSKEGRENSYFNGYVPWETFRSDETTRATDAAIQHIKEFIERHNEAWKAEFVRIFDDRLNNNFGNIGYRLCSRGSFTEWLTIFLIPMHKPE